MKTNYKLYNIICSVYLYNKMKNLKTETQTQTEVDIPFISETK